MPLAGVEHRIETVSQDLAGARNTAEIDRRYKDCTGTVLQFFNHRRGVILLHTAVVSFTVFARLTGTDFLILYAENLCRKTSRF